MSLELPVALVHEGLTDSRVLEPLIIKIINAQPLNQSVQVRVASQRWDTRRSFPEAFVEMVQDLTAYVLVVAHLDADADDDTTVRRYKIEPAEVALARAAVTRPLLTWAIPIQAIEAWLLASPSAFARALRQPRREHELDWPRNPETIHRDAAKRLFDESVKSLLATTHRKRLKVNPAIFQPQIIDELSLNDLRRLPAFLRFEDALVQCLAELGVL